MRQDSVLFRTFLYTKAEAKLKAILEQLWPKDD